MSTSTENIRDRLAQRRKAMTDDIINSLDAALQKHGVSEDHPARRAAAWASQLLGGGNAVKLLLLLQLGMAALDHVNFEEAEKAAESVGVIIQIEHNSGAILPLDSASGQMKTADEVLERLHRSDSMPPPVPTRGTLPRTPLPHCPAPTTQWDASTEGLKEGWIPGNHEVPPALRFQL